MKPGPAVIRYAAQTSTGLPTSPMTQGSASTIRVMPEQRPCTGNDHFRLAAIPPKAHEYEVSARTPLERFIDRCRVARGHQSGIVNDPIAWFGDARPSPARSLRSGHARARVLPCFAAAEDAARLAEVMSFALAATLVRCVPPRPARGRRGGSAGSARSPLRSTPSPPTSARAQASFARSPARWSAGSAWSLIADRPPPPPRPRKKPRRTPWTPRNQRP